MTQGFDGFLLLLGLAGAVDVSLDIGQVVILGSDVCFSLCKIMMKVKILNSIKTKVL